jgi:branched-chain amino acid transport system substrate-binding protein
MVARVVAVVACLALNAALTSVAAAAPTPYRIPVILSLSGPAAFLGKEQAESLRILEDDVNRHGGVAGTLIHFDVADDQTSPQVAVQLANAIVASHAPAILGSSVVATCAAIGAVVKSSAVEYCLSPGVHPEPGSYQFSSGVSTYDIFKVALRYFRLSGTNRISILTSTDATGQDADRALDAALLLPENQGVTIAAREHFSPGDVSVTAQMARIKDSHAQAVMLFATGTPFGTTLRAYVDSGMTVPIFTSTGNMTYAQMTQYAQFQLHDLYFVGLRFFDSARIGPGPLHDAVSTFVDAFKTAGTRPDVGQGLAWDPGLLVVAALKKYGTGLTADQLRDFIAGQRSFVGINGLYNFPGVPQRGINDLAAVMARWDPSTTSFAVVSKPGGVPR